jgi:hypothetical protein
LNKFRRTAQGSLSFLSDRIPAADDAENDHDESDHQQNVNESSHRIGGDDSQKPQDDQDDGDGIEHVETPSMMDKISGRFSGLSGEILKTARERPSG